MTEREGCHLLAVLSSEHLLVAATTADMAAALNPCSSSASTPAIVVPPGEQT